MFIIKLHNQGHNWWLPGTTWTNFEDRAFAFPTEAEASAALIKAKPFMKANLYKIAEIILK